MDAAGVCNSWFVLRLVLLLEDQSVIYLGATNSLFTSMIETCRWISEPPWGTRWFPSSHVCEQYCGPGYPPRFRPKGVWCLNEDARHLWRLMCFADLKALPSVQLHLPVPVVFRCRQDLLSLWDLCRGMSCYGNRMFLISISLLVSWHPVRSLGPGTPVERFMVERLLQKFLEMRHLGLSSLDYDSLEVDVLYPSKGSVKRRKILITLTRTPSIDDGSYIVPLAIHGMSQQSPSFFTSSRTDELDQRCLVLADDPLGQSILGRRQFALFLAPQYVGWTYADTFYDPSQE